MSSRHASLLEIYVFVAVDERGEHVMSDQIYRRCNGKQQGRRRGGRSVQLPDSFMTLHSSSRRLCTFTYVLYVHTTKYIQRGKRKKDPSEVRSRNGQKMENNTLYMRIYLSMFFLRKRVVLFMDFLMTCGRWGHVFATGANPRSCIKKLAVSPSFIVRMGENVKPKCFTFELNQWCKRHL